MSIIELSDEDLLPDVPAVDSPKNPCVVCGVDIPYKGKGRKPTKCDDHKRTAEPTRPAAAKGTGKNDVLARQAAAALGQVNALIATGLMVAPGPFRLPATASAIAQANDTFTEQAYNALLTDPKLCQMITRAGAAGGKFSLLIAYGMLAATVVPTAVMEYRENQEGASEDRA